jgi:Mg2+/Co2+ transporter CorB
MSHINVLWILLFSLILLSSFFSIAETAYMSVNRYRMRHFAKKGINKAKRAQLLLERPDRLLGIILLGDTFSDILASAIATLIAIHYFGDAGVIIATIILTFVVLIFAKLAPKTWAALHPTPIVLYTAWPLWILLKTIYPIVWIINILSNGLLSLFGIHSSKKALEDFTTEELRTVVADASKYIPRNKQRMLLQLLDLEKIYVEDIMIPRNEIVGLDLDNAWPEIIEQLTTSQHTRLPVYHEHPGDIVGLLHMRDALNHLAKENLTPVTLQEIIEEPYFIPEGTSLSQQLLQFCQHKQRTGLVVDEYGDILGLVALEDILEEIVGEFTTDTAASTRKDILVQPDGSYLVDGSVNLRVLNRTLKIELPLEGPKTLSGLIIEYLETIPPPNICVKISGLPMEILQVKDNMIKIIRLLLDDKN